MPRATSDAALRTLRSQFAAALAQFLGDDFHWPVVVKVESRSGKLRLEFKPEDGAGNEGTSAGNAPGATPDATAGATACPASVPRGATPEENSEENLEQEKTPEEWEASIRRSAVVRKILDGADRTPKESIQIAQDAGAEYDGRWRYWVAVLVRLGYLERNRRTKKLRKLKDLDDD